MPFFRLGEELGLHDAGGDLPPRLAEREGEALAPETTGARAAAVGLDGKVKALSVMMRPSLVRANQLRS